MDNARNRTFDMAKVLATIFILFHHYQMVALMITSKTFPGVPFYDGGYRSGDFSWGYMVELFFLISGYFTLPYIRKISEGMTFYRFYTHRVARILPVVAVSNAFFAAVLLLYDKVYGWAFWGEDPSLFGVVLQALGIQSGWCFRGIGLNSVTWYCSVLLLCSLLFYGIVCWSHRLGFSPCYGFACMIVLGCSVQTFHTDGPFLDESAGRGYVAFFAGLFFAMLMPLLKKWRITIPASIVLLVLFALEFYKKDGNLQYMAFTLTFLVYPAVLLLLQQFPFTCVSRLSLWEGWAKISYGVFLWHLPTYILAYCVVKCIGLPPEMLVSVPMMILFAIGMQPLGWLSYKFLEKPLNLKAANLFAELDPAQKADTV